MKEFRLEIKIKNNLLYRAIKDAGFKTIKDFCKKTEISYQMTCHLITMRISPISKVYRSKRTKKENGVFIQHVYKICNALNKTPSDLFSQCHIDYDGPGKTTTEIGKKEIDSYLEMTRQNNLLECDDFTDKIDIEQNLPTIIDQQLNTLTPREAKVIRMRFGIDMNSDYTLEEIGKQFDVNRERIRQIEAKALRKLRHHSRSKKLVEFIKK